MEFIEAIAKGIKQAETGSSEVRTKTSSRHELIESWGGRKHFQNIGNEEIFNAYLPDIEAGKYIIGPAYWVDPNHEIRFMKDSVGLYFA